MHKLWLQYKASLQCLVHGIAHLPREQLWPLAAVFFLTALAPLSLLAFEEARTALQWALMHYAVMHALVHWTRQLSAH
jgi:hypothetical protein